MLRWLVLSVTFATWSASLALVYLYCRPAPIPPEALANQQALEYIFSDKAVPYSSWRVYLNPQELRAPGSDSGSTTPRDPNLQLMEFMAVGQGAEPGEVDVGFMVSTLKKRDPGTVELANAMKIQLPPGSAPALLNALSPLLIDSRSNVSADDGILDFFVRITTGVGVEAQVTGFKDRDKIRSTQTIFDRDRPISEQPIELPAREMSAPSVSPAPLNDRPPVQLGQTWKVLLLAAGRSGEMPRILHALASVKQKTQIRYRGRDEDVFFVEAEVDGNVCLGWYTASGRLLKQHFRYENILNITLVRSETDDPDPALPEPGWGKIFPKREKSDSYRAIENRLGS